MNLLSTFLSFLLISQSQLCAHQFAKIPYLIGDKKYWLTLNSPPSTSKGYEWNFDTPTAPPLLSHEVIRITKKHLNEHPIANKRWKISSLSLHQFISIVNNEEKSYSYYQVQLREVMAEDKRTNKKQAIRLSRIEVCVTMDGEIIAPNLAHH